ncbi:hypothetical protein KAR91_85690 [Candidatus Pacearchaeota archaeon]|nr:hypothetical protein [Candidatus Pacearchaeota archaeon]
MPGSDANQNLDAAETIAYGYNLTGKRDISTAQFSVAASTDKVNNYFDVLDHTNILIRFNEPEFPESS